VGFLFCRNKFIIKIKSIILEMEMKKNIHAEGNVLLGISYFGCISNKKIKLFNKYNSNCE
jgi:hypothetical protein